MRVTAQRIRDGQALRDAMKAAGVSLQALAGRTAHVDPAGKGVSYQLIGFLSAAPGSRCRNTTTPATATMIEDALGVPAGSLFERVEAPSRGEPQPAWENVP